MTNDDNEKTIRVGSRKSELALIQTKHVIARLQKLYPSKKFEIHTMSTIGDRVLNISLPKIGEKSLFTRDLEDALRNGGVDFVVHSLKDLPTALPTGMAIGAVLEREDARDALVLRTELEGHTIATLPAGSIIGTSSLRRTAQIRRQYPHLKVCDIRGNLNTRLAKLDAVDSKFAGIILAQAGLVRMGWMNRISQVLEPTDLLYAVGQGALAVECRGNDTQILEMLQSLTCISTTCRILAERSFLKKLGGGCSAPVAVWSKLSGDFSDANGNDDDRGLSLVGAVWSLDGVTEIRDKRACSFIEEGKKRISSITLLDNCNDAESNDEPPKKRSRENISSSPELKTQNSPPVINDDAEVDDLTTGYNVKELIEKHIDLAMKCPVVGVSVDTQTNRIINASNNNTLANGNGVTGQRGGGDAEPHCPLKMDVGQDFMGQCPFVSNEAKVTLAVSGKCPLTKDAPPHAAEPAKAADEVDNSMLPSTSKCPFSALHKTAASEMVKEATHGKCPFLQKTVKMFDYADEQKPLPKEIPALIEDVENLFCGLYQHACHSRELYVRSNELGQQLADELIRKGALKVMKCAQDEIHSKA